MREQMKDLDDLKLDQDLWADVRGRTPRPIPSGPSNRHRMVAALTTLALTVGSVWLLMSTFGGGHEVGIPTGPTTSPQPSFDGWHVSVSLEPTRIGPLQFSVGRIAASRGAGWVHHTFTITNVGKQAVELGDARTSVFVGEPPKSLMVADWGCGYASGGPGKPVHAGACESYLDAHVLKPGHKITRTISLLKELPGMSRLTSGTYVFEQPVTFKPADRKGATLQGVHVRLTYTIDKVAPLSFAPADGWYDQTYIHLQGSSDPSQAWTSNRPFDPTEQAPALPAPPTLDEGGVLVIAWEVVRAPADPTNPNFPVVDGPIQLVAPSGGYEGQASDVTRSQMLAQLNGRYIQVWVYFGSAHPSTDTLAAAQSALDRLVVLPPS